MGLFVILISCQSDFTKSFTSLSCISGRDAAGISLRLWRRFAKRMFVCTVALRLLENWFEAMPALFESLSAVLKPVGTSFLSTNIFVEDGHREIKESHEAPKSVTRCFY